MKQEKPKKSNQSQQGVVSLIVVSILTVTLALIAVGFSKLSDRELRRASNRELASQAYYAAQSGINDAEEYIKAGGATFTNCNDWPHPMGDKYFTTDLSNGSNLAKYSCITVDRTPKVLANQNLVPGQPWIVKIDASNLRHLYIGWENSQYSAAPAWLSTGFGKLPQYSTYVNNSNTTGVLRVGVYQVPIGDTNDDNNTLASYSSAYYLYPNGGGGSVGQENYNSGDYCVAGPGCKGPSGHNGYFVHGDCNDPRVAPAPGLVPNTYCNSRIQGLRGDLNYYYLYFTAQYAPLKVFIQGTGTGPVTFNSTQSVIDVTGQAGDQIQRVRANVGASPQFLTPNFAVQSMQTLCKGFVLQILPSTTYTASSGTGSNLDSTDCQVPTGLPNNLQNGGMAGH